MPKHTKHIAPLRFLSIDRTSEQPLYLQLVRQLRQLVLNGDLPPGQRLPSTRWLTKHLEVSRTTVVLAFEQLVSEGYLVSQVGSGTYVNHRFSTAFFQPGQMSSDVTPTLSARGQATVHDLNLEYLRPSPVQPFLANMPAVDLFPRKTWGRIENRIRNRHDPSLMAYGEPGGYEPLRQAIADYVLTHRGIKCTPDQVIVTTGTQRSLGLISAMLCDPGQVVLIEDPSSLLVRRSLVAQGLTLLPTPVDESGAAPPSETDTPAAAKLAYLTPSCQYPLGYSMPIDRRIAWLAWADSHQSWIIEDDLDNEFVFGDRAAPTLFANNPTDRTLYVSSFNNTLFPSIRLGFILAPKALAESLQIANAIGDRGPNTWQQAVLAEFINQGHLITHSRRTHAAYGRRRDSMIQGLAELESDGIAVRHSRSSLRVIATLPATLNDKTVQRELFENGIISYALSDYSVRRSDLNGLLLGFGCTHESEILPAMRRFRECLHSISSV